MDSDEVVKMIRKFDRDELMDVVLSAASHSPRIIEDIRRVSRRNQITYHTPPPVSSIPYSCVIEYYYISHGDGKCALKSFEVPPRHAPVLIHHVVLEQDAFRMGRMTYRWFNDPKNQDFLQSLKAGELPKEFLLKDGITRYHVLRVKTECKDPRDIPAWGRVNYLQM